MKWWAPLLACAWGLSSKAPPDPSKVDLPTVPQAKNVGKDGFPELPSLEDIMNPAVETMSGISSRAKELEAKMLKMEKENSLKLSRQKQVFDRKLREQEEKNQKEAKANAQLAKSIMQLKKKNEEVFADSRQRQEAISIREKEVKLIQQQLSAVQKFLSDSLNASDQAGELKILEQEEIEEEKEAQARQEKQKLDSYLTVAEQRVQSQEALSFLAISEVEEPEAEKEPENLLNVLAEGVKDMKQQGEASSKRLKKLFLASLQDGVKRHKALLQQQSVLKETLKGMESYEARLAKAAAHLKDTKSKLDRNLHESGLFLQKLSQLTLAKPEESFKALSKNDL